MTEWVLDASAMLALMRAEPGADQVARALSTAIISTVNVAEVVTGLLRGGVEPQIAQQAVLRLNCPIAAVDADLGFRAGALWQQTRANGLSLGDRICVALAEREKAPALTANRAWQGLELGIQIQLIR
jgi:ribonuclease VapC